MDNIRLSNTKAVPQLKTALKGVTITTSENESIKIPQNEYWGDMTSKDCGLVIKLMIKNAENEIIGKNL